MKGRPWPNVLRNFWLYSPFGHRLQSYSLTRLQETTELTEFFLREGEHNADIGIMNITVRP
jgi:hypothetical protein